MSCKKSASLLHGNTDMPLSDREPDTIERVISCRRAPAVKPTLVRRDMRYWLLRPDSRLSQHVLCYFFVEPLSDGSPSDTALPFHDAELLIPDGYSEIVFNFGARYARQVLGGNDRRSIMGTSYIIGGRSHSVTTQDLQKGRLAGVKLDPRALRSLIGTPLTEFSDVTLCLRDLNNASLFEVEDAIACADSPTRVAEILDRFFLKALCGTRLQDPCVDRLVYDIQRRRGTLPIMQWIRGRRVDSRSLERRFSASIGMTPKRYARIVRFKHSYHRLIAGKMTQDALHLDGYYDQSHFNKEFRHFVGVAPSIRIGQRMPLGTGISDHLLEGELGGS